jgi:hypothetical protein
MGAAKSLAADPTQPPTPRHVAMNWARRLKRVLGIEIDHRAGCGGELKIIASMGEPQVIAKTHSHLERTAPQRCPVQLPLGTRAPPVQSSLLRTRRWRAIALAGAAAGFGRCVPDSGWRWGRADS